MLRKKRRSKAKGAGSKLRSRPQKGAGTSYGKKKPAQEGISEQSKEVFPPQGDGFLAKPCGDLYILVGRLLHDVCIQIDSHYVDLSERKKRKFDPSRALILSKITKLIQYVNETHKSGNVVIDSMEDKVTEDGLVVKEIVNL